jgi:predicted small lipoprotein YifL
MPMSPETAQKDAPREHQVARTLVALRRAALAALLLFASLLPLLAACGKRGPPSPPGPPSEVTYPKVYPTE